MEEGFFIVLGLLLLSVPVAGLVLAIVAFNRAGRMARKVDEHEAAIRDLRARLAGGAAPATKPQPPLAVEEKPAAEIVQPPMPPVQITPQGALPPPIPVMPSVALPQKLPARMAEPWSATTMTVAMVGTTGA